MLNRDQPENIDHELWMDTDQPLPTLNLFTVSAVNDMTVSTNSLIITQTKYSLGLVFIHTVAKVSERNGAIKVTMHGILLHSGLNPA